jgi:type I restriction enzyme M protein
VSLPSETFIPYGTGIKTSVLFAQKKSVKKPRNQAFMAQVRRVGYDVKGRTIFSKDKSGAMIADKDGGFQVNTDVPEVGRFARSVLEGSIPASIDGQCVVSTDLLTDRLDVEFYQPNDKKLIEELGALGAVPLKEIATFVRERDHFREEPAEVVRYVAIADVDTRLLAILTHETLAPHDAPSRASYRLQKGDLITALSGASTGTPKQAVAIVGDEEDGMICSNGFGVLRDVKTVHPYYLAAFMRSDGFLRQVRRYMTGHAIPSISLEDLGEVLIPLPSAETNRRVTKLVSELIELRKKAVSVGQSLGEAVAKDRTQSF